MNVKVFYLIIAILIFEESNSFSFRSKINDLIKKAKEFYRKQFHKDKTWHFLGYDKTEYPGTDEKLLNVNREKWQEYYDCLKKQEDSLENHGSIIPEALLAFQGQLITLECKVCLSPSESDNMELVEWYFGSEDSEKLLPIDITEHILVSPQDKTLHLYNLAVEQTGQYVCQLNGQLTAPYFVTVVSDEEPLRQVQQFNASNLPEVPWILGDQGLALDTVWSPWTPCSQCNTVGKRHKTGYCVLGLVQNLLEEATVEPYMKLTSDPTQSTLLFQIENKSDSNTLKVSVKFNISSEDMEILRVFKYGVPCRSHILPHLFKNIAEVGSRPSEMLTGLCKGSCPRARVFVVKDADGRVLETANNSAGVYSMAQGPPPAQPDVQRTLLYQETDSTITLVCPGNLNTDTPLRWQIGSKVAVPALLAAESGGRVHITVTDKLVIKIAKVSDSDVYSCWQNKELAGAIRLIVEKCFKLNFNHHMMLFGIVLIMVTFIYVFVRAFLGRKNVKS